MTTPRTGPPLAGPSDLSAAAGSPASDAQPAGFAGRGEDYYRRVLQDLPVAVYTTDAEGRIAFFNDAAAALWGRRPTLGEERWCGSWRLFRPDGTPMAQDESPMAVTLKTGRAVQGAEAIAERPDGTRYPFAPYPSLLVDADGQVQGALNVLVDVADRRRGEEMAQRLAAVVESSDDAIISKNLNGIIESWNKGAERLFGYTADEAVGKPVTILFPADRVDEEPGIIGRIARGERVDHYETVRRHKDGSLIDISLTVSPVRDAHGRIVGASKIARDNRARKQQDDRQKILFGEMKHRANNLSAIIAAIARQTVPKDAPAVADFAKTFLGRIQAILAAGELAVSSSSRTPDLGEVVRAAVKPFFETEQLQRRITIAGPAIDIPEQTGGGLALAFHELATNAFKYGALSSGAGTVAVDWTVARTAAGRRIELVWRERGGPPAVPPTRKGFGTRVIRAALAGAPEGAIDLAFEPQGLTCSMTFCVLD